jgi:uncharacterized membrane protein YidH (DUF202 family)
MCGNQLGNVLKRKEAIDSLKTAGSSPLFLTAVILYTVSLFFQLVQIFSPIMSDDIADFLRNDPILRDFFTDAQQFVVTIQGFFLLILVLPALACAGMWMFYTSSRDIQSRSTAGLTMIKVSNIISYSLILLILIVFIPIILATGFGAAGQSGGGAFQVISSFITMLMLGMITLLVFYLIGLIKTINIAIRALRTGVLSGKISMFVIVINYIGAGFMVITALTELSDGSFSSALFSLCSAAASIVVSIFLGSFRSEMKRSM